jgi:hypothetical protein
MFYVMDVAICEQFTHSLFKKNIWIFYDRLIDTSYNNTIAIFYKFWTKFRYYYNYYVLILHCKVELYMKNN